MGDLIESLMDTVPAAVDKKPVRKRKAAKPARKPNPMAASWYGPPEQVYRIPNAWPGAFPYLIVPSTIEAIRESVWADRCSIQITKAVDPIDVGVGPKEIYRIAPWTKPPPKGKEKPEAEDQSAEEGAE